MQLTRPALTNPLDEMMMGTDEARFSEIEDERGHYRVWTVPVNVNNAQVGIVQSRGEVIWYGCGVGGFIPLYYWRGGNCDGVGRFGELGDRFRGL